MIHEMTRNILFSIKTNRSDLFAQYLTESSGRLSNQSKSAIIAEIGYQKNGELFSLLQAHGIPPNVVGSHEDISRIEHFSAPLTLLAKKTFSKASFQFLMKKGVSVTGLRKDRGTVFHSLVEFNGSRITHHNDALQLKSLITFLSRHIETPDFLTREDISSRSALEFAIINESLSGTEALVTLLNQHGLMDDVMIDKAFKSIEELKKWNPGIAKKITSVIEKSVLIAPTPEPEPETEPEPELEPESQWSSLGL